MRYYKRNSKRMTAGSRKSNEPRLVGSILIDMLHGWNTNTELGCDVKTILRTDRKMKVGKEYQGIFRLDSEGFVDEFLCRDPHFTFIEAMPQKTAKRNPHVFDGRYISVTRRGDGSLRLNFKELPKIDGNFNLERFALGVYNEICLALGGLIEEADSE